MAKKKSKVLVKIKVFLFKTITLLILITIIISALWINHIDNICKDVYGATEYYMTESMFNNKKLLKVNSMKLTFCDKKSAVVEVRGMNPQAPYGSITYKAYLTKAKNDSWKLGTIYDDFK